jgi:hypothetical protein
MSTQADGKLDLKTLEGELSQLKTNLLNDLAARRPVMEGPDKLDLVLARLDELGQRLNGVVTAVDALRKSQEGYRAELLEQFEGVVRTVEDKFKEIARKPAAKPKHAQNGKKAASPAPL